MKKEKIEIRGTYKTPKIVFDLKDGIIKIIGRSTMIKPNEFYPNIINQLKMYCDNPKNKTLLIIDLEYYNTMSAKYLVQIAELISKIELSPNCSTKINWYYDSEDIDMKKDINFYSDLIQFKINAVNYELAEACL